MNEVAKGLQLSTPSLGITQPRRCSDLRRRLIAFGLSTPSLGITLLSRGAHHQACFHRLSTPSLGITGTASYWDVRVGNGVFQLPLSGSPDSGGDDGADVLQLSTPSLGITLARNIVIGLYANHAAFNSLSRDHLADLAKTAYLLKRLSFNSLSRDHLIEFCKRAHSQK